MVKYEMVTLKHLWYVDGGQCRMCEKAPVNEVLPTLEHIVSGVSICCLQLHQHLVALQCSHVTMCLIVCSHFQILQSVTQAILERILLEQQIQIPHKVVSISKLPYNTNNQLGDLLLSLAICCKVFVSLAKSPHHETK